MKKCFFGCLTLDVFMASIGISEDQAAVDAPGPPAVKKDQPMSFLMEKNSSIQRTFWELSQPVTMN